MPQRVGGIMASAENNYIQNWTQKEILKRLFYPGQEDPKQELRLKRFYMALASYAMFWALTVFCYWQGYFLASWTGVAGFVLLTIAVNLVFYLFFIKRWNLRLNEPSMTLPQMVAAILIFMSTLYFYTEEVRGAFLILCYIIFMFGVLKLKVRHFLLLTILVLLLYGFIIALLYTFAPHRVDFQVAVLHLVITAMGLFWFSLVGGYISQLRSKLANTNAQLQMAMDRIEELASLDHLTGVYNRRKMMEVLEYEKKLADRTLGTFSIMLLDLDHFKEVNDIYGHLAGDNVLRVFTQEIGSSLREVDFLARYGGEEFLVLLPRTGLQEALQCAERLRQKSARIQFPGMPQSFSQKISIGIAKYCAVESLEATLQRMDQALYAAKENGRNRVEYQQNSAGAVAASN